IAAERRRWFHGCIMKMKTPNLRPLLASAALLAACAAARGAPEGGLTADQLPDAVRRTLETQAKNETVKQITRDSVDGRTVYEIELERDNAINPRIRIDEDGLLVRPSRRGLALDPTTPILDPTLTAPVM